MTSPAVATDRHVSDIANLASLDTWSRPDLDGLLARLRAEQPVSWHEHPDSGRGFWSVVRHADIEQLSTQPQLFSNKDGARINHDPEQGLSRLGSGTMLEKDPPENMRDRKYISRVFTPKAVGALEDLIRERARAIIASIAPMGECEFVSQATALFPLHVICDMMGVPEGADRQMIFELIDRSIGENDATLGAGAHAGSQAVQELKRYGRDLGRDRSAHTRDDLMSRLVEVEVDGLKLEPDHVGDFFSLLIAAGNETTRHALSHGLLGFSAFPLQRERFMNNLPVGHAMAHEVVRWATPTLQMRRTVMSDVAVGGQQMRAGDKIAMWFISANRDEAAFERPFEFDVLRDPNGHQAFGAGGPHFCLGAHLARLEIIVFFEELFSLLPDIAPIGPPEMLRSVNIRGVKRLPVKFTPAMPR